MEPSNRVYRQAHASRLCLHKRRRSAGLREFSSHGNHHVSGTGGQGRELAQLRNVLIELFPNNVPRRSLRPQTAAEQHRITHKRCQNVAQVFGYTA
jgi:hypothetical protein